MKKFHLNGEKEGLKTLCGQTNYGGKKVQMVRIKSLDELKQTAPELQCKKCVEMSKAKG